MMDVPNSCSDTEDRPCKKPKVVEYGLPEGFLDPIHLHQRQEFGTSHKASMCKQFWKAGDFEGPVNNNQSISNLGGMDHLRVHPRFLHSNATSHKWALGAFAELLDNSLDEVHTGATYVNVDVLNNEIDTSNMMLLVEDNGGGMTPDKMRRCMSLGYSIHFEKRGEEWGMMAKSSHVDWERNKETIVHWSPYSSEEHLLQQSYAAILYLNIPNGFRIILRGKDVSHHNIIDDMMLAQKVMYKPTADGTKKNDQNQMSSEVTLGFVKDAKNHIDVQGFNPFWRVWNAAGSDGRGVIGMLEANFVEPAHDKQEFERTSVLSRLENRLVVIQKKYWSTNCQEIGYAKRCKAASDTKCKPSIKDKSDEGKVSTVSSEAKLRPIRKIEASKPVEFAHNDEEAYTGTVRKIQSTSMKESKASTSDIPSETTVTSENIIARLRKENFELKQRLENSESVTINNLLLDLRSERDKNVLLENQVVKAQETIEKLDQEQVNLIDIFSEERERRNETEDTLRNKLEEAINTIEELRWNVKVLEKQSH
ncbi:hypothetical protein L1987_38881 [Smallanthus sonchifolius]|uniref:Uncharacterized protein n=1 Tax=Smallanthus sonchifolius TaxID=185202 RepID=A0ACB9HKG3_9ASTR|nr:hypothetical protein L1987_38881 [Smallanthus sonchifolius]